MDAKLQKIVLRMSRVAIYAILFLHSVFTVALPSTSEAQRKKLNEIYVEISSGHKSVLDFLVEVEQKSDFTFAYSKQEVKARSVHLTKSAWIMDELLKEVSVQARLSFRRVNETITIREVRQLAGAPVVMDQVNVLFTVTGVVRDENDEPLPGATILEKGTTNGTVTDANGLYTLDVTNENATLVISFLGYSQEEIAIAGRSVIDVTMSPDIAALQEVVVIGYGTVQKRDVTGSVSSVKSEELVSVPVIGLDQALQGRAAGVYVSQAQAEPGGNTVIRIRGTNSIQGNNDPLYVIDGFIGGSINTVDPSDIESIDILKDASATSIYGTSGANGVVIITTKKGKAGKSTVSLDAFYGWQQVTNRLDLLEMEDYARVSNALDEVRGTTPFFDLNNLPPGTDWQDEIFEVAPMQNYNLKASGGTDKLNYYFGVNYIDQQGVVIGSGFERYNFRVNIDSKVSEKLTVGTRMGLSRVNSDRVLTQNSSRAQTTHQTVLSALLLPPNLSPYDENGDLVEGSLDNPVSGAFYMNPVNTQLNWINESLSTLFNGNLFAEYSIIEGLKFRTNFGVNITSNKDNEFRPSTVFDPGNGIRNFANVGTFNSLNWLSESFFTYTKDFSRQRVEATVGFTAQENWAENLFAQASNFSSDQFEYHNLAAGSNVDNLGTNLSEWARASFFGRIHYVLNDKYLFTFNSRYDGSSRFGDDNKWGFFPSAAVAWRIGDESFIQDLGFFNDLKFRASYGVSGSDALGPFQSFAALSPSANAYNFNGQLAVGYIPNRLANPGLGWEETVQFNAGLDVSLLEGRLNLVFDYYHKETSELFLDRPLPETSGVSRIRQNIGALENEGIELGIDVDILTGDFSWRTGFNMSINTATVTDLGDVDEILVGNIGGNLKVGNIQVIRTGEELGSFFGYTTDGIWQLDDDLDAHTQFGGTPQPGDIKFVDYNNDGDVNALDRQIIGNANPDLIGGFNNNFTYKGFDATLFFNFSVGNDVFNANNANLVNMGDYNNKLEDARDFWTPANPSNEIPRPGAPNNFLVMDRYIEDASFLRLRELTLGYNLPKSLLGNWRVERLRLYATVTNLFTITDYSGFDPEVNVFGGNVALIGTDNGSYPRARTYVLGVNLSF